MHRPDPHPNKACAATVVVALALLVAAPPGLAGAQLRWEREDLRLRVGGHVKGFLVGGPSLGGDGEAVLTRNRVALDADFQAFRGLRVKVDYRVEAFGSIVGTADLAAIRRESEGDFLDLDGTLVDEQNLLVRHRLHRAVVSLDAAPLQLAVGRQRIAWGTGKLWSPTDLFNPVDPLSLERAERRGADAVLARLALAPPADLTAVYAPVAGGAGREAARLHATIRGVDVSALAGARPDEAFVGADMAAPVGQGLFRAEALAAFPEDGRTVLLGVVAAEYTFPSSLSVVVEYFGNGAGADRSREYRVDRLSRGEILALGRRLLGVIVGYDPAPLWRAELTVLQSLTDGSTYLNPRLGYAVTPDTEIGVGAGVTQGHARSEFGRLPGVYYLELRWTF